MTDNELGNAIYPCEKRGRVAWRSSFLYLQVDIAYLIDGPALASLAALADAYMEAKGRAAMSSQWSAGGPDIEDATLRLMPGGAHVAVQSPGQEAAYLRKVG